MPALSRLGSESEMSARSQRGSVSSNSSGNKVAGLDGSFEVSAHVLLVFGCQRRDSGRGVMADELLWIDGRRLA